MIKVAVCVHGIIVVVFLPVGYPAKGRILLRQMNKPEILIIYPNGFKFMRLILFAVMNGTF
jgi:hypothetical protein